MLPPSPSEEDRRGVRLFGGVAESEKPFAVEEVIPMLKPVTPIGVPSPEIQIKHTI